MDFLAALALSSSWMGDWLPLTAIGLSISAVLVAIGWMLGELLRGAEIRSWARSELNEFIVTGIIVAVVVFSLSTLYTISLVLSDGKDFFVLADSFFSDKQNGLLYQTLASSMTISGKTVIYEAIGDFQVDLTALIKAALSVIPLAPVKLVRVFIPEIVTKPFGSVDDISSALDSYASMAFFTALLAYAQVEMLRFFKLAALQFVFPAGLVLRAFPITRKVGSTVIALAIVGATVYPLSILVSSAIYNETHALFGSPALPLDAPTPVTTVALSPPDGTRVSLDDTLSWGVENGSTYRVWKAHEDDKCVCPSATCAKTTDQPPASATINEWSNNLTLFDCLKLVKNGTADSEELKIRIGDIISEDESDKIYSFVLDSYNTTNVAQKFGWAEIKVIVGDPCKQNWWTRTRCFLGHTYKIAEIDTAKGAKTIALSTLEGSFDTLWSDTIGTIGLTGVSNPLKVLSTPLLASHMFLKLTDEIPAILYPQLMVLVTLVISSFMSLSTFRSVSETIGGETELPGLAKVL